MGSDDLFHKRKARRAQDLARRKARRASYDRVLIVCEGAKTEPNYLRNLIDSLELNTANVEVDGDSSSSPISVVEHSKKRYSEDKRTGDSFDRVFCVFDKDTHASYKQALSVVLAAKPKKVFEAVTSVPCFEYWLLLHYKYTTKPFVVSGSKSSCENLIDELKKYFPSYSKGNNDIYKEIEGQTAQAIAWSKQALKEANKIERDNPSTLMHELVEYLQHLKD
ncbi:RloB domain-containing protein [Candidatus Woesearchaeota archaeon]|nr:RloB domain-containing protein [Candidatus Woesearchaeota archaeon]